MRWRRFALFVFVWTPIALVAALSAAAALAAQGGRVSLRLDILAQFAPLWLAGGSASLVAAFLFRGWPRAVVAALAAVALVSAASLMAPEFLRDTGPKAAAGAPKTQKIGTLKLVQFNVWHENADPEAVMGWLDAERPDIAVLEENSPRFQAAAARHPDWQVSCARCEVTILSRQAPVLVETPRHGRRGPHIPLTRAVFRDARGTFELIGVHNAWPTDAADQQGQERRLAGVIAATPRGRTIVAGDFNSTPWSFSRRRWDRAFGLIRRDRGIASWPARRYKRLRWAGLPFLAIDHVYAGPEWATVSVERGPRLSSDHYPLIITLAPVAPR